MLLVLAFPGATSVPIEASPSLEVVGFAFAISMLTGILFGVAPAWIAAQADPADALRSGTRSTAAGASLLQRILVVTQAALSLVLLVGAGLFTQNLNKLQSMDLKLNSTNRYIVHINPQANGEYFDSVSTRVVMGRGIGVQDTSAAPPVAVVNQQFVNQFMKNQNPIGQRIGYPGSPGDFEVVGVVEDTVYTDVRWKNHSMYFVPIMQRQPTDKGPITDDMSLYAGTIVLETARPMSDLEAITRKTLAEINPNLTVVKYQTFDAQIAERFTEERMVAKLTALFGGLALLLATIGLYGVTAYGVVRRTPEIGIRMALGAGRRGVIAMVMRGAVIQTVLGLTIGIPIALLSVRFVKSQLYEITSADSQVMLVAIAALAIAACIAGYIPARRAASIDPVKALRTE
jgi:macrolide transport system ATP-binding/permease protein